MTDWWSDAPVVGQPALDTRARDYAIRTVYGEAANEPDTGQAAVAAVIKNRMDAGRYGGTSVPAVVLAKNQFEPWNDPKARARMMALAEDHPAYQKIGGLVDSIFTGQMPDPTNGATHFVAPEAQAALGRSMPSWAQGDGQAIGRHTFFAPEGRVQTAAAPSGDWWSSSPIVSGAPQDSGGGQFAAPLPDGGNFRTAREGIAPPAPTNAPRKGTILPTSIDAQGNVSFDSNAGLLGMLKSAVTLPGDVASGKVQMMGPDGHTNPEAIQRSAQLASVVPMASAPGGAFAAQVGKGLPVRQAPTEAVTPSIQELKNAATAGYKSPEVTDLAIKPNTVAEFAQATKAALNKEGFDDTATVARGTFQILDKLEKAPEGAFVTGQNLHSLKKTFGNAAKEVGADGLPTPNAAAARQAMKAVDEFIGGVAEKDIVSGDPAAALSAWKTADANYSAAKTAEGIDRKVIQAQNRAGATNSGQNVANTVRQRLATVMNSPEFARFKPDEQEMIRQIVHGTPTANAVRFVGKLLGGGGGLGAISAAAIGGYATGGPGAIAPVVGFALNALSNRMTTNQAAKLSEMIRARAPLAKSMEDFGKKAVEYQTAQTPRTISATALAARNLSNNLKDAGILMSPADIFKSLQGPVRSAAEQDQQN